MQDKLIEKLIEYLENSQDFMLEQMPEIIQQALAYNKVSAMCGTGIMLGLLVAALFTAFYSWKRPALDVDGSRSSFSAISLIGSIAAIPMIFSGLWINIDKLLKIYIAPKYYLIQLFINMKQH